MTTPPNRDNDPKKPSLSPTEEAIIEMMKRTNMQQVAVNQQQGGGLSQILAGNGDGKDKDHAFWKTQPMPHEGRHENVPEGPIVPNTPHEELRQEPYTLPAAFEWSNVNVKDDGDRLELYNLLADNYVEDGDALFRFDYSEQFLMWALTPPEQVEEFVFGVRSSSKNNNNSTTPPKKNKLLAFISAIPTQIKANDSSINVVEINFLCVHKKLRSKRLAPVLIKEVTRRANLRGIFQAVYTAGSVLPVPVASARYYHRSLNPKKLVKVGFSRATERMTLARMQKLLKLPQALPVRSDGRMLRPMETKDVEGVHKLLTEELRKFQLKVLFTKDEIAHWFLPRDKVINSYVIEAAEGNGAVTDFCSFYHLPSSILHHDDTLHAAYAFYNVATSMTLTELMKDALILAKNLGSDVFNALDLMQNREMLEPLKFSMGDGNLQYYLYNWSCPEIQPNKVGIVLL